jgi:hypothetical protein
MQQPKGNYTDSKISCHRKIRRKVQNASKLITNIILNLKPNLPSESIKNCKSLIRMELLLNISIQPPMAFATEEHQQFGVYGQR